MSPLLSTRPGPTGALASLSLSVLLSSLGTSMANVSLPSLTQAFGASFQQVQWVVLSYLLAMTALVVVAGRLGDRLGRRRLLMAGLLLFTLASVFCARAPSLETLVAARALQGLGAATMMTLAMAMTGDTVGKERTGSAMGWLASMSAVGTALGPSAGGLLIAWLDWRAMFLSTVPLSLLTLWLVHRHLPAPTPVSAPRSGTSANATTLWQGTALGASLVMNALVATVMMATLVIGPFFLSGGLGLEMAWVGAAMSAGPVMSMVFGFVAGKLVDRWGAAHTLRTGLLVMLAGALGLAVLPGPWGLAGYLLAISVLTPGYQLFQAANNTATLTRLPAARRGEVSGLLNLARNLGLMAGASVMGWVFAWVTTEPAAASPATLLHGVQVTFGAAAGLLVLSMFVGRTTRPAASGL